MAINLQNLFGYGRSRLLGASEGAMRWCADDGMVSVQDFGANGSGNVGFGSIANNSDELILSGAVGAAFAQKAFVGNDVFIPNCGNVGRGTDLVAKIINVNKTSNVITLDAPALAASTISAISPALIMFDDARAFDDAITAFYANGGRGGKLRANGFFNFNRGFYSNTNSLIRMPFFNSNSAAPYNRPDTHYLGIFGDFSVGMWGALPIGGTIFNTILNGTGAFPQFIAARAYASTDNNDSATYFNHVFVELEGICFRKPLNSGIRTVSLYNAIRAKVKNCHVEPNVFHSAVTSAPNQANEIAYDLPGVNNNVENYVKESSAFCQHTAMRISEHCEYDLLVYKCSKGVLYERGFRHKNSTLTIEHTPRVIEIKGQADLGNLTINGEVYVSNPSGAWFELRPNEFIFDPEDKGFGSVNFNNVDAGFGNSQTAKPSVTGCSNVKFTNRTTPFVEDDGTTNSLVVDRVLPTPPIYDAGAILIDEFKRFGNLDGRKADVLNFGNDVWAVHKANANSKINVTDGKAIVSEGYAFATYDSGGLEDEAIATFAGGTNCNVVVRHTLNGSCYSAFFDNGGAYLQIYSFNSALGGVTVGAPIPIAQFVPGATLSFKILSNGTSIAKINGVVVPGTPSGLTAHTGTRVGFGGSETVALARFQAK